MAVSWKQLTIVPSPEALAEFRENWGWLVPEDLQAFMASASGDLFLLGSDGHVHWLDTGQGELTRIAESRDAFLDAMRADGGAEWLLASLIDELVAAGVVLAEGQCYGYRVLPILGGDYTPDNMAPMSAVAWYGFSGHVHRQLHDLPDGAHVQLEIGD